MEQLNRVELRGIAGLVKKTQLEDGRTLYRVQMATNYAYLSSGSPVIETTWHTVTFCDKAVKTNVQFLDGISRGTKLYICGRLRNQRYTTDAGAEVTTSEILAKVVYVLDEDYNGLTMEQNDEQ